MIDNEKLIKENFLNFENNDIFYLIKIFVRKKDAITSNSEDIFKNVFGSHNERLLASYVVNSLEDFEKYTKICKHLLKNVPYSRAYFNVNPKSKTKALLTLNNQVQKLMHAKIQNDAIDISKKIQSLSYSILSKPEANVHRNKNFIVVDVDVYEEKYKSNLEDNLKKIDYIVRKIKELKIWYIQYKTINGLHIILKHKDMSILKNPKSKYCYMWNDFINNDFVDIKENAAILLYA